MATDIQLHKQQAQELSNKLWAIANDLRGTMDASKFKDYILGIIFYRFLSEKTEKYMEEILKNDGMTYADAIAQKNIIPVMTGSWYAWNYGWGAPAFPESIQKNTWCQSESR